MVSVHRVSGLNFDNNQNQNVKFTKNNSIQLQANDPNLLNNFMSLMASQNRAAISFGMNTAMKHEEIKPYGKGDAKIHSSSPRISDYGKFKIKTEASNRIYGKNPWPQIDNIDAWMISAETADFMFEGGLGQVATGLPNSFNEKSRKTNTKDKMTIVTPMYIDNSKYSLRYEDGNYFYQYGKNKKKGIDEKLPLKLMGTIDVPVYNNRDGNTNLSSNEVRVFKTEFNGTEYLFLDTSNPFTKMRFDKDPDNFDMFNIEAHKGKNNAYVESKKSRRDDIDRMAFFSKATYETMKAAKEGKLNGLDAPNIALLNDWHAGPVAALTKYMATAEADYGQIDKDTGKYFSELPTIFIAHNMGFLGATRGDQDREKIFNTLFQGFSKDILENSKSWDGAPGYINNTMFKDWDFTSAGAGVMIADRIVPVSANYAQELTKSPIKANGFNPMFIERTKGDVKTLTPIINGYSKTLIEPTKAHVEEQMDATYNDFILHNMTTPSIDLEGLELLPYDGDHLENKIKNKNTLMKILKETVEREKELQGKGDHNARRYYIEDPWNTEIPDTADFSKIPVMTYVGRIDQQKGVDSILWGALAKLANESKGKSKDDLPVIIIGGFISDPGIYGRLCDMKRGITGVNPDLGKRIILIKDFVRTHFVASGADLFLVPSVYEPCGLTQLEAMAKGAIPVATSTGGLVDTIKDGTDGFRTTSFFDQIGDGSGNKTKDRIYYEKGTPEFHSNSDAYYDAMSRALDTYYNDHYKFEQMQKNAMQNDFSWDKDGGAIDKYISLMRTGKY